MATTDFIHNQADSLRGRLDELHPFVEEAARLRNALDALDGVAPTGYGRPRRPRTPGGKKAAIVEVVKEQPGRTAQELSADVDAHINYVYRLTSQLSDDGVIERRVGGRWYPVERADA